MSQKNPLCTEPGCYKYGVGGYSLCPDHSAYAWDKGTIEEAQKQLETQSKPATKHDTGKPRTELLSPIALLEISKVLAHGAKLHGEHNWREGFKWSRLLGAALRHLLAFMGGEDLDKDTGLSHLAHLGCCVMFLLEHEVTHKNLDDRYKKVVDKA